MSVPTTASIPDSPFIPGTKLQFAWDSVSLTAAMSCWRRYYYQIILGLEPKGPSRAIALHFGIAFHKGMEHFHRHSAAGLEEEPAIKATVRDLLNDPHFLSLPIPEELQETLQDQPEDDDGIYQRNAKVRTRYHLLRAVVWYLYHYSNDQVLTYITTSGEPAVELSFRVALPVTVGDHEAILCGHIDRACVFEDYYYVLDYKTTKALSSQFFADFELSHQITGYTLAGQVVLDKPVRGAIIDGIALQVGGCQFKRHISSRTSGQINEYLETVQHTLDQAEHHHHTQQYPMNTSACYFCHYKDLCNKPPEFREQYINMLYNQVNPWNPLENR